MRRLIIGDINGCYVELLELLDRAALSAEDEIIALGDIVDRGPDSPRVLEFFRAPASPRPHPRARSIQGNHERKHLHSFAGEIPAAGSQQITRHPRRQLDSESRAAHLPRVTHGERPTASRVSPKAGKAMS